MAIDWSQVQVEYGASETITLLDLFKSKILGCSVHETGSDKDYTLWLQMAGEAAERYCENTLAQQQAVDKLANSQTPVTLSKHPFVDDGALVVEVDGEDVSADFEVFFEGDLAIVVKGRCDAQENCCFEQMKLTYNAGFDPLPAELGYVIARAAAAYNDQIGGRGQVKRESIVGVGTIDYAVPDDVAANYGVYSGGQLRILDSYKAGTL